MRYLAFALLPALASAAVYPPDLARIDVPKLLAQTAHVRSLDRATLTGLVPLQSGLFFVGCPNCNAGRQEHQLVWSPDHPDEVYCQFCRHRYPSAKYPMNQAVEVTNSRGETHRYPYWENPSGYRYFFAAKRDDLVREYLAAQTRNLALLWAKTADRSYAERAAWLLTRFSQVFPGWAYHFDYPFQQKRIFGLPTPRDASVPPLRLVRWTWWAYLDMPDPLLESWDLIRDGGVIDPQTAALITRDLFRNAADQILAEPEQNGNMSPTLWRSLVRAGRILGDSRYTEEPIDRLQKFIEQRFFYDGSWAEGAPSYAAQTVGGLRNVLRQHGNLPDPPALDLAARAFAKLHFPDGRRVPVHDTWSTDHDAPLSASRPFLLPALGHAALAGGDGPAQWQAHLTWAGGYGHQHANRLSLLLWTRGRELLSDLGYTHTRYRPWTLATVAHNTVVIDEQNQEMKAADGTLRFFDASHPRVQVVGASGERAYPNLARTYRRTLITVDARYLVDYFEVEGGQTHDYFLHADADLGSGQVTLPGPSTPAPDLKGWTPTRNEGEIARIREPHYAYGFLRSQREMPVTRAGFVPIGMPEDLRIHFLAEPGDKLYSGVNPSVRGAMEDDANLDRVTRAFFRARRLGGRNTFISVIELTPGAVRSASRTSSGVRVNNTEEIEISPDSIRIPALYYSLRPAHRARLSAISPTGITVEGATQPPSGSLILLQTADNWVYPLAGDGSMPSHGMPPPKP